MSAPAPAVPVPAPAGPLIPRAAPVPLYWSILKQVFYGGVTFFAVYGLAVFIYDFIAKKQPQSQEHGHGHVEEPPKKEIKLEEPPKAKVEEQVQLDAFPALMAAAGLESA